MKKTTITILILVTIGVGVLMASNYVTRWINNALNLRDEFKEMTILDHREKMRAVLRNSREGLLYAIQKDELDVMDDDVISDLIFEFIAPIKSSEFGEVLLVRISPDERVLYDSSSATVKPIDVELRTIADEVIVQGEAREVIEEYIQKNKIEENISSRLLEQDYITAKDLDYIHLHHPQLFELLDQQIVYSNLFRVEKIINEIRKENTTVPSDRFYWVTKQHGVELLEWVTIPPGALGFDYEPGSYWGIEHKNQKWVLVLRSEKDSVLKNIEKIEEEYTARIAIVKIMYVLFLIILIMAIIIIVYYISKLQCNL